MALFSIINWLCFRLTKTIENRAVSLLLCKMRFRKRGLGDFTQLSAYRRKQPALGAGYRFPRR
jgi:hypothetical protein